MRIFSSAADISRNLIRRDQKIPITDFSTFNIWGAGCSSANVDGLRQWQLQEATLTKHECCVAWATGTRERSGTPRDSSTRDNVLRAE